MIHDHHLDQTDSEMLRKKLEEQEWVGDHAPNDLTATASPPNAPHDPPNAPTAQQCEHYHHYQIQTMHSQHHQMHLDDHQTQRHHYCQHFEKPLPGLTMTKYEEQREKTW
jgi:hypothetical protein